jgi:hypothetical protein
MYKVQRKQQMKVTRARLLAQQLVADDMVDAKDILQVQAMIAGIIFGNPAITDEEIGTQLAHDLVFDLVFR